MSRFQFIPLREAFFCARMQDIQECIGHRDPHMTDRSTHVASSRVYQAFVVLGKYRPNHPDSSPLNPKR
ncbi:hypothetical protein Dret_0941 [Desulfohalobium retbaense DSM 5692]|uniref:Uncharacterized protein n=1 Tax=Desulfohalobium retbaense (strain ATCC 49708 / DSM 5692 / JCM 16813 / HR100) TaxID=485915 RepID=C8X1D2_DESRD|nr:hypothetical protein Dret_0941 [Desulfohalobium retbaense DSM 5692]